MTDTAIAADLDESLDIESGLTAKVTLDLAVMIYILTKLRDVILGQVLDSYIGINSCCGDNIACGFATDTVDVGQNLKYAPFVSCTSIEWFASLALTLLVLGIFTDDHYFSLALDDLTLFTHFFDRRSDFH